MTLPLLLCVLCALGAGLYFGGTFAGAHRRGRNPLLPVLAHAVASAALVVLGALLDATAEQTLWMIVATASLAGLSLGALLPRPLLLARAAKL